MSIWMDGISTLMREWQLVSVILFFILAGQSLNYWFLRKVLGDDLTSIECLSLGLGGWLVPASLISLIWYWTRFNAILWILPIAWILCILLRLPLQGPRKPDLGTASVSTSIFLTLVVLLFILLRLTYVSGALFPLYFDSAQHYTVIKNIMENDAAWMFNWLSAAYYHLGFHYLTAFFASSMNMEITLVMLVLGQVILAMIPFSVFFLVRYVTKSNMAGWFAVILSAFGWYMPAHAVDWGKYPALMSLGLIPFVLSLAYLISHYKDGLRARVRWMLYGILGLSALLTVFTHSRSLIVFGIILLTWFAGTWWQRIPQRQMFFIFMFVVVITISEAVFIQRQDILALLFDPYLQNGTLITALVLILSIFARMEYPRLTFVSVLTVTLLLGSIFIPVTVIPDYRDLTLLDRPFVEMILFLPLSLLGGLGLAGLEKKLSGRSLWGGYIGLLAIGIVLVNAFFTYNLYPSDCCVIVGNDDVAVMDWMEAHIPVDARIGIASTELKVLASDASEGDVGADTGIWITPLTGRVTFPVPFDSRFDEWATWERLCELEIGYVFVGEAGEPFDTDTLDANPEWYRPLLSMQRTRVYEVIGCD